MLDDKKTAEQIHSLQSGQEAYALSRKLQVPHEKTKKWAEWLEKRVDVMRVAIKLKFEQNSELLQGLMMTAKNLLIEDHAADTFW